MQPVQMKMVRAALGLSADDLAKAAGIPPSVIADLEQGTSVDPEATQGLHLYLANQGIELIDSDGVRAKRQASDSFVTVDDLTTGNDGGQG